MDGAQGGLRWWSYCDHEVVAMTSVKTGEEQALDAHGACNGEMRGESLMMSPADHEVVAMTSVKTSRARK